MRACRSTWPSRFDPQTITPDGNDCFRILVRQAQALSSCEIRMNLWLALSIRACD